MSEVLSNVQDALKAATFGKDLPPLSEEAKLLLNLSGDEKENPKVLALIAQKDPVFCGRLMSIANSVNYAHKGLTSSMDGAVRRLGVELTYSTLVSCAMSEAFNSPNLTKEFRTFLLKYTLSLTITARKLANWLTLDADAGDALWLAALLYPCGIFAGLTSGLKTEQHYLQGLEHVVKTGDLALQKNPYLEGFLDLSAAVGQTWLMPEVITSTLQDCSLPDPLSATGAYLKACSDMVAIKKHNQDESPILQDLKNRGFSEQETSDKVFISLAFVLV